MSTAKTGSPHASESTSRYVRACGAATMLGAATLAVGAATTDLGAVLGLPFLGSLGSALSAGSGLGLLFLPLGLRASGVAGRGPLANLGGVDYYLRGAREAGDGWRVPPPPPAALGIMDESEAEWLAALLGPQPLGTFEQPARLGNDAALTLPRTFIRCLLGPVAPSFAPFAARFGDTPGLGYHELETGHDAMLTMPEELSARLMLLSTSSPAKGPHPGCRRPV